MYNFDFIIENKMIRVVGLFCSIIRPDKYTWATFNKGLYSTIYRAGISSNHQECRKKRRKKASGGVKGKQKAHTFLVEQERDLNYSDLGELIEVPFSWSLLFFMNTTFLRLYNLSIFS
ncbi:hypothetical protein ACJX0J_026561 [Zea mays]